MSTHYICTSIQGIAPGPHVHTGLWILSPQNQIQARLKYSLGEPLTFSLRSQAGGRAPSGRHNSLYTCCQSLANSRERVTGGNYPPFALHIFHRVEPTGCSCLTAMRGERAQSRAPTTGQGSHSAGATSTHQACAAPLLPRRLTLLARATGMEAGKHSEMWRGRQGTVVTWQGRRHQDCLRLHRACLVSLWLQRLLQEEKLRQTTVKESSEFCSAAKKARIL
ncbi:UNVERIFIED_CONTAM: hypothetical protein K2H54_024634 [Gekko kuhli]